VNGGRGKALTTEGEMDKGNKEEALDPITMDEDQIKKIMEIARRTCSGVPYRYNMNTKKRVVVAREGCESNEEGVEDLQDVEKIEEIHGMKYKMNMRGPRVGMEVNTSIHISVSVEPINQCATNTRRITPPFR
jgi:hypothetical protein